VSIFIIRAICSRSSKFAFLCWFLSFRLCTRFFLFLMCGPLGFGFVPSLSWWCFSAIVWQFLYAVFSMGCGVGATLCLPGAFSFARIWPYCPNRSIRICVRNLAGRPRVLLWPATHRDAPALLLFVALPWAVSWASLLFRPRPFPSPTIGPRPGFVLGACRWTCSTLARGDCVPAAGLRRVPRFCERPALSSARYAPPPGPLGTPVSRAPGLLMGFFALARRRATTSSHTHIIDPCGGVHFAPRFPCCRIFPVSHLTTRPLMLLGVISFLGGSHPHPPQQAFFLTVLRVAVISYALSRRFSAFHSSHLAIISTWEKRDLHAPVSVRVSIHTVVRSHFACDNTHHITSTYLFRAVFITARLALLGSRFLLVQIFAHDHSGRSLFSVFSTVSAVRL